MDLGGQKKGNAGTVVVIAIAVFALIFLALGLMIYQLYKLVSIIKGDSGRSNKTTSAAAAQDTIDCSGVAKVPKTYLPWVKEGADRWLKGDQAALIAVITFESRWNTTAISNTGAVGLGQFTAPTARSKQSFKGQIIVTVPRAHFPTVTTAEKDAFRHNYMGLIAYSGRFKPGPSIIATAEYLKYALAAQGGDLYNAYLKVYNNETPPNYKAAEAVVNIYNSLKSGGGCKES